jgi:DnaD/phage-associated family protein
MPKIQDLTELEVVLYVAYLTGRKPDLSFASGHSSPQLIEANNPPSGQGKPRQEFGPGQGRPQFVTYEELKTEICRLLGELDEKRIRQALDSAAAHGALVHSTVTMNGILEDVYSLPPSTRLESQPTTINIFTLYEQNIGVITPMIAEELKEAESLYPPQWIEDAFREAVALNKRSWRYIARILERWASEGKDSGEYKRDTKKDGPDKYVRGKYGHLVKR